MAPFQRRAIISRRITLSTSGVVGLSYAGMLPSAKEIVHGGRVKLLHLGEVYPEGKTNFNILYLVSSALPRFAEEWVQVCKAAGVRIVWNQNGVGYPAWAGENYEVVNRPMRNLIHQADFVIYQSEFCQRSSDKFLGGFAGPKTIVYNCVDTEVFTPGRIPEPEPVNLLIMGSHLQPERVFTAIHTLSVLKTQKVPARLKIAGRLAWPGADREVRHCLASLGLGDSVGIAGPYLQQDAPALYREAHVLLHFQYNDASPTVPIEAMACGVPVIGSQSGGVPELLGASGGIAVEVKQGWERMSYPHPEQAAQAVLTVVKDWERWSRQARQRAVENYDKQQWLSKHKVLFQDILHLGT